MANAELIVGLCEKFHCLPSQLYGEDADIMKMVKIVEMGKLEEGGDEENAQ